MRIIVIMHARRDGPGSLGEFFRSTATVEVVKLFRGERLPVHMSGFDAVVSLGGHMNVYEEKKYPFLRDETAFLRRAINSGTPVLGICLGAQMIAKACGATVKKAPVKEIGWRDITLTEAGLGDALFRGLPKKMRVFQWHEDTFELPDGATLLATSGDVPNQAFRCKNAYGLQFHIEVTCDIISDWSENRAERSEFLKEYECLKKDHARRAVQIYANFVALAKELGSRSRSPAIG